MFRAMIDQALVEFKQKNMGFRSRRLVDTATDANAAVSKSDLQTSFPSQGGTFDEGANLVFGTGTGTKIGTAANQKIAFYGATPIIQPIVTGAKAGNLALTSLIQKLALEGLIQDSTT